jgi:integrase
MNSLPVTRETDVAPNSPSAHLTLRVSGQVKKTGIIKRGNNLQFKWRRWIHNGYTRFALAHSLNGKYTRVTRASFEELERVADELHTAVINGETEMLDFGREDRARYRCAVQNLRPTGHSIESATAIYTEAVQILPKGVSLTEAARFYVAHHPDGVPPKNVPELVEELFSRSVSCSKWKTIKRKMLDRFTEHFTGPLNLLQSRDVDDWLYSLQDKHGKRVGLRTRRNYRAIISELCNFAKSRGYVLADWNILKDVSDPEPPPVEVNLYTPDELVRLLNKAETYPAGCKLVPFIAITALAGVRHGEMNEDKARLLDWADLDFETRSIYIGKSAAKTGRDRVVDMPDNLIAWLKPYIRPSGRICPLANTSNALCRLRARAGITGKKKNALRKSFISYKNALTRNIDAVADQAGNSAGTIRKTYKRVDTRMKLAAERWFAIMPERADMLPLFAHYATAGARA